MAEKYDCLVKLLLIGDSGVGKSNLLMRFSDDIFSTSFITTIGIDFKIKTMTIDGKVVKLQIWDTAGQERFRTITTAYYRGAMGILLVYDTTDEASFANVRQWMKNVEQHAARNVDKILVGNKSDLANRVVSSASGAALAQTLGVPFIETSAKTGAGVQDAFITLARAVMVRVQDSNANTAGTSSPSGLVNVSEGPTSDKKKSCRC